MRLRPFFLFVLVGLAFWPAQSLAHGTRFFEFAPENYDERLKVAAYDTVSQEFPVYNDFLRGLDIWIDNEGGSGAATFGLYGASGGQLAAVTVTIPVAPPVWGGTRFHFDFSSLIPVNTGATYTLKLLSFPPELWLHYVNRFQILPHNSQAYPEYLLGTAYLGASEQPFSFKFALYETTETSPPLISNATTSPSSPYATTLFFNANEPVDFDVNYARPGQAPQVAGPYGSYATCPSGIANCSLTLDTLPGANYNFTLTAYDSWGNQASTTGSFVTPQDFSAIAPPPPTGGLPPPPPPPSGDITPPQIISATISNLGATNVNFVWTTNEAANSWVTVSRAGTFSGNAFDPTYELEHSVSVSGLAPATTYTATLLTADPAGNAASSTLIFTTLTASSSSSTPPPPQIPPSGTVTPPPPPGATPPPNNTGTTPDQPGAPIDGPISVAFTATGFNGTGSIVISFNDLIIPKSAEEYRIDVFDENFRLTKQIIVPKGSQKIQLDGFAPGNYYLIAYYRNKGTWEKLQAPIRVTIVKSLVWDRLRRGLPYYGSLTLVALGIGSFFAFRSHALLKKKRAALAIEDEDASYRGRG